MFPETFINLVYTKRIHKMADDFFNNEENDPFNDIINNFFGRRQIASSRNSQRRVDYSDSDDDLSKGEIIEDKDRIYLIFELPGFAEKDISIAVKGDVIEIKASRKSVEKVQDYLSKKLKAGLIIRRNMPNEASNKFTYTYKNGILEVILEK